MRFQVVLFQVVACGFDLDVCVALKVITRTKINEDM